MNDLATGVATDQSQCFSCTKLVRTRFPASELRRRRCESPQSGRPSYELAATHEGVSCTDAIEMKDRVYRKLALEA